MRFSEWLNLKEMKTVRAYANSLGAGQVFSQTISNTASEDGFKKIRSKYMAGSERNSSKHNIDSLFKKKNKIINKV